MPPGCWTMRDTLSSPPLDALSRIFFYKERDLKERVMKKFADMVASNVVLQAILFILLGLLLAIWPDITIVTIIYLVAGCLALSGLWSLFTYFRLKKKVQPVSDSVLVFALLLMIIALIIFIFPEAVASIFALVLGAILILSGVVNVVRSLRLKEFGGNAWIGMLIVSALVTIGGIIIVVNPFSTTVSFVLVLGILLIAKGAVDLVVELLLSKKEGATYGKTRKN